MLISYKEKDFFFTEGKKQGIKLLKVKWLLCILQMLLLTV